MQIFSSTRFHGHTSRPFPDTRFTMSLKGQVVLITGGCKNLGALIARQFAAEGAILAPHYNSSNTKKAANEIAASLGAKIYQGDLTIVENCNPAIPVRSLRFRSATHRHQHRRNGPQETSHRNHRGRIRPDVRHQLQECLFHHTRSC